MELAISPSYLHPPLANASRCFFIPRSASIQHHMHKNISDGPCMRLAALYTSIKAAS